MTKKSQLFLLFTFSSLLVLSGRCFGIGSENTSDKDSVFRVIRATPHFGLVVPHHEDMVYFVNDFSYGLDINYGITKYDQSWFKYLNYPEIGFGLFYNSFGNPEIYGYGLSAYSYIHSNLYRSKKFSFQSKVALGLGYVNRPYNEASNPFNHVFGSNMNVFINFGLNAKYKIAPNWAASLNLAINHLSNGAVKQPNHGVNTLTCGIGIGYYFNNMDEPQISGGNRAPRNNARDVVFFLTYGRSQRSLYKPNFYPAVTLNVNHLWWISKKTAWGIGIDGIYYGAAPFEYDIIEEQQSVEQYDYSVADKMYGAVFGSYNFRFNRTQIFVHVGAYLIYNIEPTQLIYPRMGVRQQIFKNLYANFSIKASFFKAEFIEFGLGYRFNYKKNSL